MRNYVKTRIRNSSYTKAIKEHNYLKKYFSAVANAFGVANGNRVDATAYQHWFS
ncbi:hypothetical protein [Scytonema sp. PRP1]|uniref:hypothetical protein n=1 Tax=Scytonema sp. PRP1 TaxID=3120513 RepID=UPI00300CCA5D